MNTSFPNVTLVPVTDADQPFLQHLYASTREAEMRMMGWDAAQQAAFLSMQFRAQQRAYFSYPDAEFLLIRRHGEPVGRLYLQHLAQMVRVVDISLLPTQCGQGLGGALLRDVLTMASAQRKTVELYVDRANRALALYQRLGFELVEDTGMYFALRRAA